MECQWILSGAYNLNSTGTCNGNEGINKIRVNDACNWTVSGNFICCLHLNTVRFLFEWIMLQMRVNVTCSGNQWNSTECLHWVLLQLAWLMTIQLVWKKKEICASVCTKNRDKAAAQLDKNFLSSRWHFIHTDTWYYSHVSSKQQGPSLVMELDTLHFTKGHIFQYSIHMFQEYITSCYTIAKYI